MSKVDEIRTMVEPLALEAGASVYDVTFNADKLVVALSRAEGIDLSVLTSVTRQLNELLEEHDPVAGSYTLEVTSPGLERPLRVPSHFVNAVGEAVTIRTFPETDGPRRVKGTIAEADEDSCVVVIEEATGDLSVGDRHVVAYEAVERARTLFEWGPSPKPGGKANNKNAQKKAHGNKSAGQKAPQARSADKGASSGKPKSKNATRSGQSVKKSGPKPGDAADANPVGTDAASPDKKAPST